MEKRLRDYLAYMAAMDKDMSAEERGGLRREMLVQIGFFQHERLIHLLVTIAFAILLMLAILTSLALPSPPPPLYILIILLLVLLVPYIRHYYILENGVQKLYSYYDEYCHM
ncbi:MAG: hypothetical protein LBI54_01190 [Lachnospiraceae bacterium]|jgi:hypothetical protein|nr:hypothetical protein [Lachnospiraceae bacterium]